MRNTLARLFFGMAFTAVLGFGSDNTIGTWKLNLSKSKFSPEAPIKSLTTTREASGSDVKFTNTGEQADGTKIDNSYTLKYDGKEYPVTSAPFASIAIKQINANTFSVRQTNPATKYKMSGRTVVSKDGKTLTTSLSGTRPDGKKAAYTMVFDKQ